MLPFKFWLERIFNRRKRLLTKWDEHLKKGEIVVQVKDQGKKKEDTAAERWISYRPEIKVLDCTIRDGGLMNNHLFTDEVVKAVYEANVQAGVDYMEFGYKGSENVFSRSEFGAWKFCKEEDLRKIVGDNDTNLKISVMADTGRTDYDDILPKNESVVDLIRVATYIHQIPAAIELLNVAIDKGYETSINIMAISTAPEHELDEALELLAKTSVDCIYVVDSFGSFYSEQIVYYMDKYSSHAKPVGKELGMHAHNNQQLAYANTIETVIKGAKYLDASMAGLGRGAGNCAMELLLGFLHNPKYNMRPILQCIQEHIEPMRAKLMWGPDIPYMITGQMNQHPREAIQFNASKDRGNIVKFFDMMNEED